MRSNVLPGACAAVLLLPAIADIRAAPLALRPDVQIRHLLNTGSGGNSVRIARDPADGNLYYLRRSGSIYRLTVAAGAGSSSVRIYDSAQTGVSAAIGFAFGPDGTVYVVGNATQGSTTSATVWRGRRLGAVGDDRDWSGVARTEAYPRSNTAFDHTVNGIAVSPDGEFLFINSGSRTDHGEVQSNGGAFPGLREAPLTAKILRVPSAANDVILRNDENALRAGGHIFAEGTRNTFDLAFAPNGDLFGGENSGDRDDSEELNWLREGRHYGFPWRIGTSDTPQQFPGYDPEADRLIDHDFIAYRNGYFHDDPTYPPPPAELTGPVLNAGPDADSFRDPGTGQVRDASDLGMTVGTFTAHRSPLGLVFDAAGALAPEFRGDGFILGWTRGDANGDSVNGPFRDPGQDLLHLDLEKSGGEYRVRTTRIASGFNQPIDAEIAGSRIYVLEYGGDGAIWEVALPAAPPGPRFIRGFANEDGDIDLADAVVILLHLFAGRSIGCVDAIDIDDDGALNITDAIHLLTHLYLGGPPPPAPHPACGEDPTADREGDLGCTSGAGCGG